MQQKTTIDEEIEQELAEIVEASEIAQERYKAMKSNREIGLMINSLARRGKIQAHEHALFKQHLWTEYSYMLAEHERTRS